ncbi:MAG: exo-alpha-sialidase, partial [Ignavibacteriae bacterium]
MKKSILLLIAILCVINISTAQERLITKPEGFDYRNLPAIQSVDIPVSNEIRTVASPFGVLTVDPNIRIFPTSVQQTELSASIWTANPNYIFIGANSDPGQGYYFTTNGGVNWAGGDLLPGSISSSSDPACAFDNTGKVFFNYFDNIMVVDKSTNGGANWTGRVTVPSGSFDKNHMAIDITPSSPYYGRIYVVWSNWVSTPVTVVSYSTNGGTSYSAMQTIGAPISGHYEQGCNIQTGPNGEVYCVWATPVSGGSYTEDYIVFTKSTNGGANWTTPVSALDINGIRGNILTTNIRVNSFPSMGVDRSGGARNGWLYLTWSQRSLAPAGSDADICFAYSSNGGTSWSTPVKVNDDALNNGKNQFFPWLTVDQTNGNIATVFYDTRDVSSADSCNTYVAVSANGGANWTNMRASDHAQRPVPLSGYATGYYGDYIAIAGHNNIFWPFWMDNRSGPAQIYTAKITLGPSIAHTPLSNTENLTGPYTVNCVITPAGSAIDPSKTKVMWSRNNPTINDSVQMTNSSGNNWTANIPGNGTSATYRYYIKSADVLNRTVTHPAGAPGNLHTFLASADVIKPVITHTPIPTCPRIEWPKTVTATITDNIGIDSGWVRWYKNNTSTGLKSFKLINTGGSTFEAAFNSDTSQVATGDSIFYRIIAQDNSSNHNRDSTTLYSFKITNVVSKCIGTGTTAVGYPYYTFYMDARTAMLYTAAEIGTGTALITKIGFDVVSAAPQTMNGFKIKMLNTTQTTVTSYGTGMTEVYSGTYSVPGTGIQYVTLQTGFMYTGGNLLVEICFNNSSYTSNT